MIMQNTEFSLVTNSPDETRALGKRLGQACTGGEIILLNGDLGAGKTCLTQGLAIGLGIPKNVPVTSPTFVLHVQYSGRLILNHMDFYRLDDVRQTMSLGWEETMSDSQGVTVLEWPDIIAQSVDSDALCVVIAHTGPHSRSFTLHPSGVRHKELLIRAGFA